jgi:protoporphyrin/coproporphyrin ferrochelatase
MNQNATHVSAGSPRQTVLLLNLGSPDTPAVPDVSRYLKEFLTDKRVIDSPAPIRHLVVKGLIVPRRKRNSAHAYQSIWTDEGSPLIVISRKVQKLLQEQIDLPVELAMRYGKPSTDEVVGRIVESGAREIILIPLYPHYAMSSYETAVEKVKESLAQRSSDVRLTIQEPFFEDPDYVESLLAVSRPYLDRGFDHILFSFHGLPRRHITKEDRSGAHCLVKEDCCFTPNPVHKVCYRSHAFKTVRAFVRSAGIPESKYSISFQSRLGREPWLQPYTDLVLEELPGKGVKNLLVICPAFVSDCLETLEEIAMRGKEIFQGAGGESYAQIPCLNDHPRWIETLKRFVTRLRRSEHAVK